MRVSQTGIDLIKHFEGLRLDAYKDVAGIWTIGYGHIGPITIDGTRFDSVAAAVQANGGQPVRISESHAEDLLRDELTRFEDGVTGAVKIDINQNQFDALVSLSYNIGLGAFRSSTTLKRLNKGDFAGAAEAITWWNKATVNGQKQVVQGLVTRRAAEKALFLQPMGADEIGDTETDSSRITPEENSPRRGNLGGSRTMEGAVVAGAGGAASAGAAWMGRDRDEEQDADTGDGPDGATDTETPGTQPDSPPSEEPDTETPVEEPETPPADDGAEPAPEAGDADAGDTDAGDTGAGDTGTEVPAGSETDESDGDPVTDGASEDTGDTTTETTEVPNQPEQELSRSDYTEAFQIIVGVIVVIAVLYIVFARIDDWRNHKR